METDTETKKVYSFKELSPKAQDYAIQENYSINTDHDWWDFTYEDAKSIGLSITGFDIGRGCSIKGKLNENMSDVINNIIKDHGEETKTYLLAQEYKKKLCVLKFLDRISDNQEEELQDLTEEFEKELLEEYHKMLSEEYDYLTSDEGIKECILNNDYEFDEDGNMI